MPPKTYPVFIRFGLAEFILGLGNTLDFGGITDEKKEEYFAAVRAGMARNYKPMQKVFSSVLKRTMKNTSGK